MVAMRMMQTAIDEVINVVAVRHRLMTASGAMMMPVTADFWSAAHGIVGANRDDVLFNFVAVLEF